MAVEDDVQEDDVEMTVEGGASSVGAPADEDAFEKQMRHSHEATTEQVRVSTVPRYVKPQPRSTGGVDERKTNSYISDDKFSQEVIFHYWAGRLPGHAHVNQTYPAPHFPSYVVTWMSLGCGDSSMVALHLEAG